ncbi:hypothetical protein BJV82DRAFT_501395, partial [Fennellomyces sp. T-0311]
INSLLYADDVAILGSPEHVHTLLAVAEQHSQALGYRWHPAKCQVIDSGPTRYTLYGEPLAKVAWVEYLGIPFNAKGIDTSRLIQHNTAKTTNAMRMLHSIGAQQYSFGLGVSLRLYRTFIRPVMEYGLAIAKLTAALKTQLERTQKRCVWLALNVTDVTATTPTIIPLHLAALPDMSLRATILQFKFVRRAHELPPTTLLA